MARNLTILGEGRPYLNGTCQSIAMSLFADFNRLTPESATILFFINFIGGYLICKYGRSAPKRRPRTLD
jgi:hypothetical protein